MSTWRNCQVWLSQKSDLRGGKPVSDMIIKSVSQIILNIIFLINHIIISDMMFKYHVTNHLRYDFNLNGHVQTEREGWMRKK
ncbi:hypothetical protein CKF46_27805 [Klebsiella pneumoniae]|nr:hypothetical protein CKF46_27805 [Klebsiella pneumoniae]